MGEIKPVTWLKYELVLSACRQHRSDQKEGFSFQDLARGHVGVQGRNKFTVIFVNRTVTLEFCILKL